MVILGQLGGVPHPEQVDALQPGVVVDNILICLFMDDSKVRITEECVVMITLLNIACTVNIPMAILGRNINYELHQYSGDNNEPICCPKCSFKLI